MITVEEMRRLEQRAVERGISVLQLMENAGKAVFQAVKENYGLSGNQVVVFCGPGNNGGDGFVAARYCSEECQVTVLFFGTLGEMTEACRKNYERIKSKVPVIAIKRPEELGKIKVQATFSSASHLILIDALLGTGAHGQLREPFTSAVDFFNSLPGYKVAVDVPSGLELDSGKSPGKLCEADLIVTFHDMKPGLEQFADKTVVADIGLPAQLP